MENDAAYFHFCFQRPVLFPQSKLSLRIQPCASSHPTTSRSTHLFPSHIPRNLTPRHPTPLRPLHPNHPSLPPRASNHQHIVISGFPKELGEARGIHCGAPPEDPNEDEEFCNRLEKELAHIFRDASQRGKSKKAFKSRKVAAKALAKKQKLAAKALAKKRKVTSTLDATAAGSASSGSGTAPKAGPPAKAASIPPELAGGGVGKGKGKGAKDDADSFQKNGWTYIPYHGSWIVFKGLQVNGHCEQPHHLDVPPWKCHCDRALTRREGRPLGMLCLWIRYGIDDDYGRHLRDMRSRLFPDHFGAEGAESCSRPHHGDRMLKKLLGRKEFRAERRKLRNELKMHPQCAVLSSIEMAKVRPENDSEPEEVPG